MDSKLVIIGAGASGIAAATKALELGFSNVILLEAENRIGGRIYNTPFVTSNIDLGAFWCDSERGHFFEKFCEDSRKLFQNNKHLHCIRSNKDVIAQDICKKLEQIIVEISEKGEDLLKLSNDSLRTYLIKNFHKWLEDPENTNVNKILANEFLEFYQKFENSIKFANNLYGESHNFFSSPCTNQNDAPLKNKESYYITFLNYLMKSTKEKKYGILQEKIFLNKKVKQIKWSKNSVMKTLITCTDGYQIEADHVFCTVSLGVLKENYFSLFQPGLPIPKINAIEGLSFQTVNKIFIEFSKPFWANNWLGFTMLWSENDLNEIQRRTDNWIEDIFGFFTSDNQKNILCAWILGENGRKMELFSDDEVLNSCVFLLKKFLNSDIPLPVSIKRSTWNTNSNFRGSYSFRSMQAERINTNPLYISTPILNENGIPIIQFCGDSTHCEYYATVRGAIESGWREAKQLANIYYNDKNVDSNIFDVLILGAGLAGLGAAYALRKSDMKVKILEAQDYIGGRVFTTPLHTFPNNSENPKIRNLSSVDTGAQWLHGEQNELYKIAQKYNLIIPEKSEEGLGLYIRDDGYTFDDFFKNKIETFVQIILEKCKSFINSEEEYPVSVGNYLSTKFEKFLKGFENFDERKKALQLLDWHIRFQMIDNSCLTLENLSAKEWGQYELGENESCQAHINLKNGFSSLISAIIAEIGGTKNILLQHEINEINWNNSESPNNMIKVNIVNNKIFFAKHVIVTFSLGILKNTESKLFKPNLPEKYRSAIKSIGFDTINKIFLQFDTRWWGNLKGIQLVYGDDKHTHNKWTRFITGFDILTPGPTNTLIGWVGGYGAVEMEKLSDEEIIEDCIHVLRKFTKFVIPDPIKYYCTRWGANKFVRGGYSYTSIQCDRNNVDKKIFTEPITCIKIPLNNCLEELYNNKIETEPQKIYAPPTLSFAGEAYHNSYFSTAHGAFLSGIEQVNFFLNKDK